MAREYFEKYGSKYFNMQVFYNRYVKLKNKWILYKIYIYSINKRERLQVHNRIRIRNDIET